MFKAEYTITTKGSRTVVRMVRPCPYPIVRGSSPWNLETSEPPAVRKPASRTRAKKKKRR